MAIKRGGPPIGPKPPVATGASRPSKSARKNERGAKTDATSDEFEEPSGETFSPLAPSTAGAPLTGSQALVRQSLESLSHELDRLETDAGRILEVLASSDASSGAIERHAPQLDRLRTDLDDVRGRITKGQRQLHEIESGMVQIAGENLAVIEAKVRDLEASSATWARALGALDLAFAASATPRRVVIKDGDRREALAYAEHTNPTTTIADLAADVSALTAEDSAPRRHEPSPLGRTFGADRGIAAHVSPNLTERPRIEDDEER